jgi:hypothetical protein
MKILNDHRGDINGKVYLTEDDLTVLAAAVDKFATMYPRDAINYQMKELVQRLQIVQDALVEKRIKREIAKEHMVKE